MTAFFIRKFKATHECRQCSAEHAPLRKFCKQHLYKAMMAWRRWAEERRGDELCISCDRKSFRGWLRCRLHTELNRIKCSAWYRANKERESLKDKQSKDAWTAQGKCFQCPEHRPISVRSTRRCATCLDRSIMLQKVPDLTRFARVVKE